jgi:predicted secreted protein
MNWLTGTIVYILLWWVILFAVLPLWVVPAEPGDPGHAAGAPKRPRLVRKALVTSLGAGVVWLIFYALMRSHWLSFRGS